MWQGVRLRRAGALRRRGDRQPDRRDEQAGLPTPRKTHLGRRRRGRDASTCCSRVAMVAARAAAARRRTPEDMLAFIARALRRRRGASGRSASSAGCCCSSATNTAVNGLMSIVYVMSRDGEMPRGLPEAQRLRRPVGRARSSPPRVPALVLLFAHDLETLASLYAIGVVGAVAINCASAPFHPRLRKLWRKVPMALLALLLVAHLDHAGADQAARADLRLRSCWRSA